MANPANRIPRCSAKMKVLVISSCLLLGFLAYQVAKGAGHASLKEGFDKEAKLVHGVLERNLRQTVVVVEQLRAFFDASQHVNAEEFETYASSARAEQPWIEGLAWAPRVLSDLFRSGSKVFVHLWQVIQQIKSVSIGIIAVILTFEGFSLFGTGEMGSGAGFLILLILAFPAWMICIACALTAYLIHRRQSAKSSPAPANTFKGGTGRILIHAGLALALFGVLSRLFTLPWAQFDGNTGVQVLLVAASLGWAIPGLIVAIVGYAVLKKAAKEPATA